jgi:tripartite-type tricarboxylate transporter receptor subunit TctC
MKRREFLIGTLASGGLIATRAYAQSSHWPNQTIRIIVPFPPGGANDIAARVLAQNFAPQLKTAVIAENRIGAGGAIGVTFAAQSKDAHTLLLGSTAMIIAPFLRSVPYDVARDFDAIGTISVFPCTLVVPANSRYRSVNDILADARARPGEVVCGNGGIGTTSHLASDLLMSITGVNLLQVSYKGEGALTPDIVSGTVAMGIVNLPTVLPHIRSGRLRALAVAASEPHPDLPDISTFKSLGVIGMEALTWVALLAAKGIPQDGLADLERMLENALTTESVAKILSSAGLKPIQVGRVKTEEFIKGESQRWGQLIRARNIKLEQK